MTAEVAGLKQKIQELGQQVRQAGDALAEAHRRRELAAKRCEDWEKQYRTLAVENMSLLGQLNESEDRFYWYDEQAKRTRDEEPGALLNAALGLAGEAGEVIEHVKKECFHGLPMKVESFERELGDVLWYLSWLAALKGTSLSKVAHANVTKLRERYPDGFVDGGGKR